MDYSNCFISNLLSESKFKAIMSIIKLVITRDYYREYLFSDDAISLMNMHLLQMVLLLLHFHLHLNFILVKYYEILKISFSSITSPLNSQHPNQKGCYWHFQRSMMRPIRTQKQQH